MSNSRKGNHAGIFRLADDNISQVMMVDSIAKSWTSEPGVEIARPLNRPGAPSCQSRMKAPGQG